MNASGENLGKRSVDSESRRKLLKTVGTTALIGTGLAAGVGIGISTLNTIQGFKKLKKQNEEAMQKLGHGNKGIKGIEKIDPKEKLKMITDARIDFLLSLSDEDIRQIANNRDGDVMPGLVTARFENAEKMPAQVRSLAIERTTEWFNNFKKEEPMFTAESLTAEVKREVSFLETMQRQLINSSERGAPK